jgi:hypothetical protein
MRDDPKQNKNEATKEDDDDDDNMMMMMEKGNMFARSQNKRLLCVIPPPDIHIPPRSFLMRQRVERSLEWCSSERHQQDCRRRTHRQTPVCRPMPGAAAAIVITTAAAKTTTIMGGQ